MIAFDCPLIGLIAFRLHSIDIRLVLVLFDSLSIDSIDDLIPNGTTSVLQVSPTRRPSTSKRHLEECRGARKCRAQNGKLILGLAWAMVRL